MNQQAPPPPAVFNPQLGQQQYGAWQQPQQYATIQGGRAAQPQQMQQPQPGQEGGGAYRAYFDQTNASQPASPPQVGQQQPAYGHPVAQQPPSAGNYGGAAAMPPQANPYGQANQQSQYGNAPVFPSSQPLNPAAHGRPPPGPWSGGGPPNQQQGPAPLNAFVGGPPPIGPPAGVPPQQQGPPPVNAFVGGPPPIGPPVGVPPQQQGPPPVNAFVGGPPPVGPPGVGGYPPVGGFPAGPPPPQRQQRLDPEMMPSIVQVVEDDRSSRSGLFPTGFPQAELPPLVTTEFIAQDQGNSNPKFIRSTLYAVPQNADMTKATHMPLSLAITPFAQLNQSEYPPPAIDLADIGPVRCQRCKAYMCPFMEFIDGGRKFRCPFCKANTTIADGYFAHLDHTGRRTDIQHRPELFLGSYEFVATKEYCKNNIPPKQPAFIFMLDVSYNAIRTGLVELFCRNIIELLRELPKENFRDQSTMRIGLATYDQSIHFYNLSQPDHVEMLVVNDITDIFVPFVDGFLVEFEQAEKAMTSCLREIVNNFSNTRITEIALGPVIQAGLDALKSADRAGKLFIFHTSLPTLEAPGQLKNREDRKVLGTEKEKTVLTAANEFYGKLGEECVKSGCAIDLFLFPNSFVDVASIAPVVCTTGGTIYKYQYFDAERDGTRFLADLGQNISREIVFDVMLRLRTSTGIRPTGFFGNFYMQNTTDIEMSALDCDKSVQIEIKYDDKLSDKEPAYFQMAALFTSCGGQRRLRIHNLSLPVTADYSQLYRSIDEDCLVTHLFKQAEQLVREKSPKEMRDDLTIRCAQILAAYREKCSESAPMGQLILPELAKLLPLHANCIVRNDSLNGGSELTVDDRAWMMSLVPSMNPLAVSQFLYPRIYPLTGLVSSKNSSQSPAEEQQNGTNNNISLTDGKMNQNSGGGTFEMPSPIRASFEYFSTEEAYLVENGLVAFIWCGAGVPKEWLHNVFNVASVAQLDTEKHELPERGNAHSRAVRRLWSYANAERERHLKLFIVKEQDPLESWMKKFLVEDRYANNAHSYVDYLCQIHREIRSILS